MLKVRRFSLALLVATFGAFAMATPMQAAATGANAVKAEAQLEIPVIGTVPGGSFEGTISDLALALNGAGDLLVSGVLNGTATIGGVATPIVDQAFSVVSSLINPGGGACDILFLDLGPLFLDVLGLQVDLSEIQLDIDAVPGAGNLLGNLLCSVAGLLDGGNTNGLLRLLSRINNIIGG